MIPKAVSKPMPDRKAPADRGARNRQHSIANRSESPGSGETTLAKTFKRMPIANTIQACCNNSEYSSESARLRNAMENPNTIPLIIRIVSFSCWAAAKLTRCSCTKPISSRISSALIKRTRFNRTQGSAYVQTYFDAYSNSRPGGRGGNSRMGRARRANGEGQRGRHEETGESGTPGEGRTLVPGSGGRYSIH